MRRELFVPLILAGLTVAFVVVFLLVYMSRGNSTYLIRKKLRIGAFILSLTAVGCSDPVGTVTCYTPPPPFPEIRSPSLEQISRGALR